MLPDSLHRPTPWPRLLTPVDARVAPLFCLLLLTAACGLASFAFACGHRRPIPAPTFDPGLNLVLAI
jgi:hypothetical protein